LLVESVVENRGTAPTGELALGDEVVWAGGEVFAPGYPHGLTGPTSGPFLGAIGKFTSYGLTSTEGEIIATTRGTASAAIFAKATSLAPGASLQTARVLVVGERPDSASVVAELSKSSARELGAIEASLAGPAGPIPPGTRLSLFVPGARARGEVLSIVAPRETDAIRGEVPPGHYEAIYLGADPTAPPGPTVSIAVTAGHVTRVRVAVPARAK
jgi:hypothetical protein